jgi:hypothetical protein
VRLLVFGSSSRIWAELHEKAFRRLGGVTRLVILDMNSSSRFRHSTSKHPFGAPNNSPTSSLFGVVPVTQINLRRDVEFGFRYLFENVNSARPV